MTSLAVVGGSVIHRDGVVWADVVVEGSTITAVGPDLEVPAGTSVIDAAGLLVAPGFIDLQVNGAEGIDLTVEPERLWEVGAELGRYGVTGFLPTIITAPPGTAERAITALAQRPAGYAGAEPLGLHIEGPMLNPARRGAHDSSLLKQPSLELVAGWSREVGVAMVTLAPELVGSGPVIAHLVAEGVVVAAGHTAATVDELAPAVDAGVRYVTHLFNAMAPLDHREPGPVGVALVDRRLTVGLIVDGIHVHPLAVAAAWAALGPDRFTLVTDAMAALGRPHGRFVLGGREVTFGDDGVRLPDGTLAGSALALDEAVRNLVAFTRCDVHEAVATVTATPARLLGLAGKGHLSAGAEADLTLLTPDLHAVATIVGGTIAVAVR